MKFNIDRMAQLAGFKGKSSGLLSESAVYKEESDYIDDYMSESDMYEGDEADDEADADLEEVEIDEAVLVQELRRMKRIMAESKKKAVIKAKRKKENLQEAQLKALIDAEVKNVLKDLGMSSGSSSWVYGKRQPMKSRPGYTHQGSYLKGIGFK